jgi:hypothetical protein
LDPVDHPEVVGVADVLPPEFFHARLLLGLRCCWELGQREVSANGDNNSYQREP